MHGMPRRALAATMPLLRRFSSVTPRPNAAQQRSAQSAGHDGARVAAALPLPMRVSALTPHPQTNRPATPAISEVQRARPASGDPKHPAVGVPRRGIAGALPPLQRKFKKR